MKPQEFIELENALSSLKPIGGRNAQKIAFELLNPETTVAESLAQCILQARKNVVFCQECGILTNKNLCSVCQDPTRISVLAVVASSVDAWHIEALNVFHGRYHILNGEITSLEQKNFEHLNVTKLLKRANEFAEIVISTNPTIYGELTANYLFKILQLKNTKVTRLASGIPVGARIDYVDELTFKQAYKNRTKLGR